MTVLVDTSVMIDHLRGDPRARDLLRQTVESGERLAASVLSKVEVLAGLRPGEEARTRSLFNLFDWIPVDDVTAERAGLLASTYLRSHPGVDPVNYVIAATAELLDAPLWTRNRRHFPMFSDLRDPYG